MKYKDDKSVVDVLYRLKATSKDTGYSLEFNRRALSRRTPCINELVMTLTNNLGENIFQYNINLENANSDLRKNLECCSEKALETGHVMVMARWHPYSDLSTGLPMALHPCVHTVMSEGQVHFNISTSKETSYKFNFSIKDIYDICKEVTVDQWAEG